MNMQKMPEVLSNFGRMSGFLKELEGFSRTFKVCTLSRAFVVVK